AHLGHGLARLVAQGDDAARVVVDDAAHVRERGRLLRAVEQRRADLLFEAAYRQAHGGLRAVDALRRLREAALLDDLQEEFQLRYLHLNPVRSRPVSTASGGERVCASSYISHPQGTPARGTDVRSRPQAFD